MQAINLTVMFILAGAFLLALAGLVLGNRERERVRGKVRR